MKRRLQSTYRFWIVLVCFIVVTLCLIWRAVYLSTWDPYALKNKQSTLVHRTVTLKAPKGEFFDRHNYPLAMNVPRYRMFIDFHRVSFTPQMRQTLLPYVQKNSPAYKILLSAQDSQKYVFAGMVDYDERLRITQTDLKGIYFEELIARYYPLGPALAQLIGRVNGDGTGVEGLEKLYNNYLAGQDSKQKIRHDRLGRMLDVAAVNGKMQVGQSIQLTIDHRIQQYAFRALNEHIGASGAKAGAVVVLNQAGDVIAMASAPSYNPNKPIDKIDDRMKNRTVVDTFEPGSTIKPIAFVGLLPHIPRDTVIDTQGGVYKLGRYNIRDVKDYGMLTLPEVMSKSSNVAMIKLAVRVGGDALVQTYKKFKLFEPSFAGLLGEQATLSGLNLKPDTVSYYALSYGYGMEVSALQLAHAYVILSNRGLDPGLHIISDTQLPRQEKTRVASSAVVDRVVDMMIKVVDEGTGQQAVIEQVKVAGKTGTTHIIRSGKYDDKKHIASFVGFAPADAPEGGHAYTIAVVIFEPQVGKHFGGQAAAPLFAKIMEYALSLEKYIDVGAY